MHTKSFNFVASSGKGEGFRCSHSQAIKAKGSSVRGEASVFLSFLLGMEQCNGLSYAIFHSELRTVLGTGAGQGFYLPRFCLV